MKRKSFKIGVLASGSGTNLQAIIDAVRSGKIKAGIAAVISNKAGSGALERARKYSIPAVHIDKKDYKDTEAFTMAVTGELVRRKVDLVCLAGFMCILSPCFVKKFRNRAINIHPALLPAFGGPGMYGHHVHEAVINSKAHYSGCTVHFVDEGCDTGAVILQKKVKVLPGDTPETLARRVLRQEHKLYPEAVRLFAEKKISVKGDRVSPRPSLQKRGIIPL